MRHVGRRAAVFAVIAVTVLAPARFAWAGPYDYARFVAKGDGSSFIDNDNWMHGDGTWPYPNTATGGGPSDRFAIYKYFDTTGIVNLSTAHTLTYSNTSAVDCGAVLNIYGSGHLDTDGNALGANSLGHDPRLGMLPGWFFDESPGTVNVYNGGQLTTSGFAGDYHTSSLGYGQSTMDLNLTGNASLSISGYLTFGNKGTYGCGTGTLTIQGYNASSSLSVGGTFKLGSIPAPPPEAPHRFGKPGGKLKVVLDSTNTGEYFNTLSVGDFVIDDTYNSDNPVTFEAGVSGGYVLTRNDVYHIVDDTSGAAPTGSFGNVLWDYGAIMVGTKAARIRHTYDIDDDTVDEYGLFLEILGIPGDANLDGLVDGQDFTILKAYFGKSEAAGAGATVPEPGTVGLLVLGALGVLIRRRAG